MTRYAEVIGRALGLEGIDLEKLRAAALLHDYGKIAVRDQFLLKPGKLDEAEFEYMKEHAEKTGEFLAHLGFPQDMRDVPVIAAQHHERMDGKGYPRGLPASSDPARRADRRRGRCIRRAHRAALLQAGVHAREDPRDHGRHGRSSPRSEGRRGRAPQRA